MCDSVTIIVVITVTSNGSDGTLDSDDTNDTNGANGTNNEVGRDVADDKNAEYYSGDLDEGDDSDYADRSNDLYNL